MSMEFQVRRSVLFRGVIKLKRQHRIGAHLHESAKLSSPNSLKRVFDKHPLHREGAWRKAELSEIIIFAPRKNNQQSVFGPHTMNTGEQRTSEHHNSRSIFTKTIRRQHVQSTRESGEIKLSQVQSTIDPLGARWRLQGRLANRLRGLTGLFL